MTEIETIDETVYFHHSDEPHVIYRAPSYYDVNLITAVDMRQDQSIWVADDSVGLLVMVRVVTEMDLPDWWSCVDDHPAYDYDQHETSGFDQHRIPCTDGQFITLSDGVWVLSN